MSNDQCEVIGQSAGSLSERTVAAGRAVLAGDPRRLARLAGLCGAGRSGGHRLDRLCRSGQLRHHQRRQVRLHPALGLVPVANPDRDAVPGAFGQARHRDRQELLWLEMCRDHFSPPLVWDVGISEIAAMATDLAEFLGGAIGLSLLFHVPLLAGMVVTAIVTYALLMLQRYGFRPAHRLIIGAMVVSLRSATWSTFVATIDWGSAAVHMVTPQIPDAEALLLAVGIIGATVMPHAVYCIRPYRRPHALCVTTKSAAGCCAFPIGRSSVRLPSQALLHGDGDDGLERVPRRPSRGGGDRDRLSHAHSAPRRRRRGCISCRSSSPASASTVGTMAGQLIMQGFVGFRIPVWVRRLVTMLPAFVVVAMGVKSTNAQVISQVVLSIALPLPMIALIIFTGRRDIMGVFVRTARSRGRPRWSAPASC